ncbi:MAG: hypothetical protein ACYSWO_19875 [Planctomycetota bacterium]|jgi:hypothetical protein
MLESGLQKNVLVVVKSQNSPRRGHLWRVSVFIDGQKFIRPGFRREKASLKLAAMIVQQALLHGWNVNWKTIDGAGNHRDINLAALGSKMHRGQVKEDRRRAAAEKQAEEE